MIMHADNIVAFIEIISSARTKKRPRALLAVSDTVPAVPG